jgi:hypothetical protein
MTLFRRPLLSLSLVASLAGLTVACSGSEPADGAASAQAVTLEDKDQIAALLTPERVPSSAPHTTLVDTWEVSLVRSWNPDGTARFSRVLVGYRANPTTHAEEEVVDIWSDAESPTRAVVKPVGGTTFPIEDATWQQAIRADGAALDAAIRAASSGATGQASGGLHTASFAGDCLRADYSYGTIFGFAGMGALATFLGCGVATAGTMLPLCAAAGATVLGGGVYGTCKLIIR